MAQRLFSRDITWFQYHPKYIFDYSLYSSELIRTKLSLCGLEKYCSCMYSSWPLIPMRNTVDNTHWNEHANTTRSCSRSIQAHIVRVGGLRHLPADDCFWFITYCMVYCILLHISVYKYDSVTYANFSAAIIIGLYSSHYIWQSICSMWIKFTQQTGQYKICCSLDSTGNATKTNTSPKHN